MNFWSPDDWGWEERHYSEFCGRLDEHPPHTWSTPLSRHYRKPLYQCPGPPVVTNAERPRSR